MSELPLEVRVGTVALLMLPYAFHGLRDLWHHKHHRMVSGPEKALHAAIGLSLAFIVPHAIEGNRHVVIAGLVLFMIARVTDEAVFHRGLDAGETDIHAKTHFGFLLFVVGLMALGYASPGFVRL